MKPKDTAATNGLIKIDKQIPMPSKGSGNYQKYPFPTMEVADSFFVAGMDASRMSGSTSYAQLKYNRRFMVRTVTENGVKGCRVWRTE